MHLFRCFAILVVCTSAFFPIKLRSQQFIQNLKTWTLVESSWGASKCLISFQINGDTVINQTPYVKLYATENALSKSYEYFSALREDGPKVYAINKEDSTETVLYDFSLNVGDTFSSINYRYPRQHSLEQSIVKSTITVVAVDSVALISGEKRRRLRLDTNYFKHDWIAGLGSTYGPHMSLGYYTGDDWYVDYYQGLHCVEDSSGTLHKHIGYENQACIFTWPPVHTDERSGPESSPKVTLTNNNLKVLFAPTNPYSIEIYDLAGKRVLHKQIHPDQNHNISVSGIAPGMYLYVLTTLEGIKHSGKLIK